MSAHRDSAGEGGSPSGARPLGVRPAAAFEAIYAEQFSFVWRNLRRLGVGEHALRDAAQDVFLVVHRHAGELAGLSSVRAWLYTILRRVASDHRRRRSRKEPRDVEQAESVPDGAAASPEEQALNRESLRVLLSLLESLEADKRDVLILADLEAMTAPEIAAALGCNLNTVYSRLRAARLAMREGYERHYQQERRLR